jgi:hypothetical protein
MFPRACGKSGRPRSNGGQRFVEAANVVASIINPTTPDNVVEFKSCRLIPGDDPLYRPTD